MVKSASPAPTVQPGRKGGVRSGHAGDSDTIKEEKTWTGEKKNEGAEAIMGKEVDEGSVELKLTKRKGALEQLLEDCNQSCWDKTIRSQRMS